MHEIDSVSCWPIDLLQMFSSQNIQQIQVFIKSQREVLYYFLINFLINCIIFSESAIVDQWDNYAYRTSLVESKLNCVLSYRWILLFFHQSFRDKPFWLDQESNARPFLFRKRTTLPAHFFLSLVLIAAASLFMTQTTRYVCASCEDRCTFFRTFPTFRGAIIHISVTPVCKAAGKGVKIIRLENRPTDAMVGGSGAAGPALDLWHQQQGLHFL